MNIIKVKGKVKDKENGKGKQQKEQSKNKCESQKQQDEKPKENNEHHQLNDYSKEQNRKQKEFYFKLSNKLLALQEPVYQKSNLIKNIRRGQGNSQSGFRGSSNLISVRASRSKQIRQKIFRQAKYNFVNIDSKIFSMNKKKKKVMKQIRNSILQCQQQFKQQKLQPNYVKKTEKQSQTKESKFDNKGHLLQLQKKDQQKKQNIQNQNGFYEQSIENIEKKQTQIQIIDSILKRNSKFSQLQSKMKPILMNLDKNQQYSDRLLSKWRTCKDSNYRTTNNTPQTSPSKKKKTHQSSRQYCSNYNFGSSAPQKKFSKQQQILQFSKTKKFATYINEIFSRKQKQNFMFKNSLFLAQFIKQKQKQFRNNNIYPMSYSNTTNVSPQNKTKRNPKSSKEYFIKKLTLTHRDYTKRTKKSNNRFPGLMVNSFDELKNEQNTNGFPFHNEKILEMREQPTKNQIFSDNRMSQINYQNRSSDKPLHFQLKITPMPRPWPSQSQTDN